MMEYRHKMMRATTGVVINNAIRNIKSDPKRSIRNLADMGDNFSTTPAQKKFFEMTHDILKNRDNPYNELIVKMIQHVDADTLRTVCLNFGYTGLNYGAEILRKQTREGKSVPWLLRFDWSSDARNLLNLQQMEAIITDAVSLGIYTYVFHLNGSDERLQELLQLCKNHEECSFFAAISPQILRHTQQITKICNLGLSVDVTDRSAGDDINRALQVLHENKCFYGFHAYYTKENAQWLMSGPFMQNMIRGGCLFGGYVNADLKEKELEEQVYRYVCTTRGKKGQPLFTFDFDCDAHYIANVISCKAYLRIAADGEVQLGGGRSANLKETTLTELMNGSRIVFEE